MQHEFQKNENAKRNIIYYKLLFIHYYYEQNIIYERTGCAASRRRVSNLLSLTYTINVIYRQNPRR